MVIIYLLCMLIMLLFPAILLFGVINAKRQEEERRAAFEKEQAEHRAAMERVEAEYRKTYDLIMNELSSVNWKVVKKYDEKVIVKSHQALDKYDAIKFFKENKEKLKIAHMTACEKKIAYTQIKEFLDKREYEDKPQYYRIENLLKRSLDDVKYYRIQVQYVTPAGNNLRNKTIKLTDEQIQGYLDTSTLFMTKAEFNKYNKELQKEALAQKQHEYYEKVNGIIDFVNDNKGSFIIKGNAEALDKLITQLCDRAINNIKKIKNVDSEEWDILDKFIEQTATEIADISTKNGMIIDYYNSENFRAVKDACETLMSSQREFNEYISEKAESISQLLGTRVVRKETQNNDKYNYIRQYQKTITPFTAEVSSAVFSSAENNPLEYVVKNFYPNKSLYPGQIQKLYTLIEELETLKEARDIIENYKVEYKQYLDNVPDYVMKNDEAGFYSRLGFANIDEDVLNIEYRFQYTSDGGMAQRSFAVPMNEENIAELIRILENKLTSKAFVKEQRALMTKKLRMAIKERDNYTCCNCGNSVYKEPNLLLEIDHIIPVSKGGYTTEENLQTLCWKCNREKSNK